MDLFARVLHILEGEEVRQDSWHLADGSVRALERRSFGPDRWIERASLGRLLAIEVLAIVLFSVRDTFNLEQERRIVEGWADELKNAAEGGEIQARDPVAWLPLNALPSDWDWMLSDDDADKFVAARGMGWKCSEQVAYLLEQCAPSIDCQRFPPELFPRAVQPLPAATPMETPRERRARWLVMLEEEQMRCKRGALQRLATREGFDHSNMSKAIGKARKERDATRRAGSWDAQLVQSGKRPR